MDIGIQTLDTLKKVVCPEAPRLNFDIQVGFDSREDGDRYSVWIRGVEFNYDNDGFEEYEVWHCLGSFPSDVAHIMLNMFSEEALSHVREL